MSGTVPPFLRGARDATEIICTADTGSIMCFSAVLCWMEREVLIGSNVYMKSGRLKGSFPMYESMKCQNFNPEENHIVPNKKFLFLQHGKRLLFQRLYMNSKKATAFSPLLFKLHSSPFPLDWKVAQLKRIFFLPGVPSTLKSFQSTVSVLYQLSSVIASTEALLYSTD